MRTSIASRVLNEAYYMITTHKTVRQIAKVFNVSKSTVHKDLHERLLEIDEKLHMEIDKILKHHIEIRHLRGGEATKKKYLKLNK